MAAHRPPAGPGCAGLIDAGLDAEAQANARSALEHAVELIRLSAAADTDHLDAALEDLDRNLRTRQAKHLAYLADLDEDTGGHHRELVAEARNLMGPPGPRGKTKLETVKNRFASIPSGPHF